MFNSNTSLVLTESDKARFMAKTYGWMGFALFISAVSAFAAVSYAPLFMFLYGQKSFGFTIVAIAELALVFWLSMGIRKMSVTSAITGFITYAVLNGMSVSYILIMYTGTSVASVFLACSIMFFVMSVYGSVTKRNLNSFGRYLMMALMGIIAASLFQMLFGLFTRQSVTSLDMLISLATVVVFTGLTAYDAQKVMRTAEMADSREDFKKVSILAALELYLDFINMFLALLRLFGRRRS